MVDRVRPGDPHHQAFKRVIKWHRTIECLPTWEEILEVEYIRQRGDINMITDHLGHYAVEHGLFSAAAWIARCQEAKISWPSAWSMTLPEFEREHGSHSGWITKELREKFDERLMLAEERRLEKDLKELRRRINSKGSHGMKERSTKDRP